MKGTICYKLVTKFVEKNKRYIFNIGGSDRSKGSQRSREMEEKRRWKKIDIAR